MNPVKKYRLVTRGDMDGLASAILLRELDLIDEITFAQPKDVQDDLVELTERDITTNLPYVPAVHLCFDHHYSETLRLDTRPPNYILNPSAPSAARVLYDFFGGRARFPRIPEGMMEAVDKSDSARFTEQEILHPAGWDLLSFIMDVRTGLGRFGSFRVSDYTLMMDLIAHARTLPIAGIMALPGVKAIVTADDLPAPADAVNDNGQLILANIDGEVALTKEPVYQGQPILAVAAIDELTAADVVYSYRRMLALKAGVITIDNGSTR